MPAVTETAWPAEPKVFTVWPLTENACSPALDLEKEGCTGTPCPPHPTPKKAAQRWGRREEVA